MNASTRHAVSSAVLALSPLFVQAQPSSMPPAHAVSPPGTVVQLQAQAEIALDNDEAQIVLYAQEQNADRAVAANAVNTKMKDAIARIQSALPKADLKSSGYNTYPTYAQQANRINGWVVRQDLTITTRELADVDKAIANVQSIVNVGGVQFMPSPDARRQAQDRLMELAFADLRVRIAQVARGLGKSPADATIEAIDLTNALPLPMPKTMMAMRASSNAEVAPPRFEPGESQTNLNFQARVRFK